ncbi:hypothetical protein R3P38DRAFT_3188501 [Favolaschia claudopus]|uniref:Uncharacterized protein n=1 Tax=Favolaschia claudopus TaxID=2862362 RepID=A0AAW0BXL0_9AGAR
MLLAGHDISEPYLASQLRKFQKTNREGLRKKLNLTRSGYFLGLIDHCHVLKEAKYISIYLFEAGLKLEQSHSHGIRHPDELQEHDRQGADTVNHRKALSSNRQCPQIHPKISTQSFGLVSKPSPGSRGLNANQPCAQLVCLVPGSFTPLQRAAATSPSHAFKCSTEPITTVSTMAEPAPVVQAQAPRHVSVQTQTQTLFPASRSDTKTDYQDEDSEKFDVIDRESVYATAAEDIVPLSLHPASMPLDQPAHLRGTTAMMGVEGGRDDPDQGGSYEELDEEYEGGLAVYKEI